MSSRVPESPEALAISPYFTSQTPVIDFPTLDLEESSHNCQTIALSSEHAVQLQVHTKTHQSLFVASRSPHGEQKYCPVCNSPLPARKTNQNESETSNLTVTDPNYFKLLTQFSHNGQQIPPELMAQNYFGRFFRVRKTLGSGAFGSVLLCEHVLDGASLGLFAAKVIPVGDRRKLLRKHVQEAALLQMCKHPNIIDYKHSWQETYTRAINGDAVPCFFLLMEYAELGSLLDLANTYNSKGRTIPTLTTLSLLYQACSGLKYMHAKGIIHRDIKPENIMLQRDVSKSYLMTVHGRFCPFRVIIGDFGSAINLNGSSVETIKACTPRYCSPEIRRGHKGCEQSDIWSLGLVLYYMTYFRHPFHNIPEENLSELLTYSPGHQIPDFPWTPSHPVQHIFNACLQTELSKRATASTLLTYISAAITSTPTNDLPALQYQHLEEKAEPVSPRTFYEQHIIQETVETQADQKIVGWEKNFHYLFIVHIGFMYIQSSPRNHSLRPLIEAIKTTLFFYHALQNEFTKQVLWAIFILSISFFLEASRFVRWTSLDCLPFLGELCIYLCEGTWLFLETVTVNATMSLPPFLQSYFRT